MNYLNIINIYENFNYEIAIPYEDYDHKNLNTVTFEIINGVSR